MAPTTGMIAFLRPAGRNPGHVDPAREAKEDDAPSWQTILRQAGGTANSIFQALIRHDAQSRAARSSAEQATWEHEERQLMIQAQAEIGRLAEQPDEQAAMLATALRQMIASRGGPDTSWSLGTWVLVGTVGTAVAASIGVLVKIWRDRRPFPGS
jgi:hypothetical protein